MTSYYQSFKMATQIPTLESKPYDLFCTDNYFKPSSIFFFCWPFQHGSSVLVLFISSVLIVSHFVLFVPYHSFFPWLGNMCFVITALSEYLFSILPLRKQAYSNILKILPPKKKKWKFSDKNSDILHISAQNIDGWYSLEPPRRGGSNEYQQSIPNNNNVYPVNPSFTI